MQCIGSVAYCDDCSPPGDGEMFTAPVVAIFVFLSCVIVFFVIVLLLLLFGINIKLPPVLISASALSVYVMSFYGAMIFPISSNADGSFVSVSIIHLWGCLL